MKFRLIPLVAVVASLTAMSAHAEGPIDGKVYGKLRLSADYVRTETSGTTTNTNELKSHASRIGFKGATKLEGYNNLSVIYQAEYGIDGQINNGNNWSARNTFLGLKSDFGTLIGGRHDTPMKSSQGKVDQFNDVDGDFASIMNGENRLNQLVMYTTPSLSGLKASVAYVMSKDNAANSNNKNTQKNGISAAVMMDAGMFYGAVAYDQNIANANTLRVTGVVKPVSDLQLGAMWQRTKCNDSTLSSCAPTNGASASDSENGYLVSAGYSIGAATLKAEYGDSDIYKLGLAKYKKDASIGADYKLAKNTKVEGWVTQLKKDNGDKTTYIALGMEHKF